jgi:hypothetical protein
MIFPTLRLENRRTSSFPFPHPFHYQRESLSKQTLMRPFKGAPSLLWREV